MKKTLAIVLATALLMVPLLSVPAHAGPKKETSKVACGLFVYVVNHADGWSHSKVQKKLNVVKATASFGLRSIYRLTRQVAGSWASYDFDRFVRVGKRLVARCAAL